MAWTQQGPDLAGPQSHSQYLEYSLNKCNEKPLKDFKQRSDEVSFTFLKDHAGSCVENGLDEGRNGTGKVSGFCRNPGENR